VDDKEATMVVSEKEIVEDGRKKSGRDKNNKKTRTRNHKKQAAGADELTKLREKLGTLEQENAALSDRLLRTAAEFDNYRKRTEAEMANLREAASAELIKDLLPVFDDFERSLGAVSDSEKGGSLYEGVQLIYKNLVKVLERRGVEVIEAVGQPFDPERHEALMQVETSDFPPGMVVEEHRKGYVMNDRVLRHSQVLVNKND